MTGRKRVLSCVDSDPCLTFTTARNPQDPDKVAVPKNVPPTSLYVVTAILLLLIKSLSCYTRLARTSLQTFTLYLGTLGRVI